jgi:hypothetical protein
MRTIKSEYEKKRDKLINQIKRSAIELQKMNYKTKAETVETMIGQNITHIYLYDNIGSRIIFQKHLFDLK